MVLNFADFLVRFFTLLANLIEVLNKFLIVLIVFNYVLVNLKINFNQAVTH
jgi:hypothetical protein